MRKKIFIVIIFIFLIFFTAQNCSEGVAINNLIENSRDYNSKKIELKGEAIGDVMIRGNFGWINILDNTGAIGVWAKKEDLEKIRFVGNYKNIGDTVKVIGIFNRACDEHGGDTDIHAKELLIAKSGHKVEHPVETKKIIWFAVLLFIVLGLILSNYLSQKIAEKKKP